MSSAFPAISAHIRTWTTNPPSEPLSWLTLTSIQTETIYPTWIYTISESGPSSSSTATTVLDSVPSLLNPTSVTGTLTSAKLSTTQQNGVIPTPSTSTSIFSESSIPALNPTTTDISSPIKDIPISTSSEPSGDLSQHSDTASNMWTPPVPLTSSSSSLSSTLPASPETTPSAAFSFSTSISSTTVPSNTPSVSPFTGVVTNASSSDDTVQAEHPHPTPPSKVGTIVGSIIGGSAFTIFALLACILLIRRRRRKITTDRLGIRQKLIRGDSMTSSIGYYRYSSYPSIPGNISPRSPKLPEIPLQQQPSNPDLSLDSMYLRGERAAQDPFADPPSAVIEVSAPSRSVSVYSTSSWRSGHGFSSHLDCEREGADARTLPHMSSSYLDTPMMRDSMRSDPFDLDLDPPPTAYHPPPVPPVPTPWGVKF